MLCFAANVLKIAASPQAAVAAASASASAAAAAVVVVVAVSLVFHFEMRHLERNSSLNLKVETEKLFKFLKQN